MTLPPDDRHPAYSPRRAGRWSETLAMLRADPGLVIVVDVDEPDRLPWLRRQLPGQVVIAGPVGRGAIAAYTPERLPAELLPAAAAARRAITTNPAPATATSTTRGTAMRPTESDTTPPAESTAELCRWLVSLDEPGSQDRRTVTLTAITIRARAALEHDGEPVRRPDPQPARRGE